MASTKNGVIYPDDYNKAADILADMKVLADSVDGNIEQINSNIQENTENIKLSQEEIKKLQSENIEVKAENERLKSDIESISLVGQAEGESIDLNDSSNARFNKFEIGGNHKQETREGYNLLKLSTLKGKTETKNGITYKINDDGSITLNGTKTEYTSFNLLVQSLKSGTYKFVDGQNNNYVFLQGLGKWNVTSQSKDFSLTEDGDTVIYLVVSGNAPTLNNFTLYPMIYEGTDDKPYEQYGAMPSPDYRSEVKTVKDSVEEKVVNNDNTQEQIITMPVRQEMLQGDYFDFENEKEVQTWGKYIFTGEESIVKSSMPQNNSYWINQETIPELLNAEVSTNTAILPQCICTHFKTLKPIKITNASNVGITINANNAEKTNVSIRIGFGINSEINTADKCKSLLKSFYEAGNPVIFYYKLSTLTQLDFTDEQKAVAKQIKETLHTYKNVTHIYSDDEVSPILNAEYAKDLNTVINNIQAQDK